ncbi:MAG: UbiA family prenyltransferase [Pseudomonadota bacterium]
MIARPSEYTASIHRRALALPGGHRAVESLYRGVLEILVYSALWTAATLGALTVFVSQVLGVSAGGPAWIIALSAAFIYNFDHVADSYLQRSPDPVAQAYHHHPIMLALLAIIAVALGIAVGSAPRACQWVFAVYTGIGLLYGLPFLPVREPAGWRRYRLKDIPFLKPWLVAGAITFGVVGLPLSWAGRPLDAQVWSLVLVVGVFALSNTHMFDIRDLASDAAARVKTLPVVMGARRVRQGMVLLNVFLMALMAWGLGGELSHLFPELFLLPILSIAYLLTLRLESGPIACAVLVEGCIFVPLLLLTLRNARWS